MKAKSSILITDFDCIHSTCRVAMNTPFYIDSNAYFECHFAMCGQAVSVWHKKSCMIWMAILTCFEKNRARAFGARNLPYKV